MSSPLEETSVQEQPLLYGEEVSSPLPLHAFRAPSVLQDWWGQPEESRALLRTCRPRAPLRAPQGQAETSSPCPQSPSS